jgi:hypothetical protein
LTGSWAGPHMANLDKVDCANLVSYGTNKLLIVVLKSVNLGTESVRRSTGRRLNKN